MEKETEPNLEECKKHACRDCPLKSCKLRNIAMGRASRATIRQYHEDEYKAGVL